MRASHLISNVEALEALGPGVKAAVRGRLPDVIREIEDAVRVAWLPLALDVALTDAIEEEAGRDAMRAWATDAIVRSTRGPLLGPLLGTMQRLGLDPHVALGRAHYAWGLVYRHCGEVTYERDGDTTGTLVSRGAPPAMRTRSYLEGIAGAWDGVMTVSGAKEPRAEVQVEGSLVRYACRWRAV